MFLWQFHSDLVPHLVAAFIAILFFPYAWSRRPAAGATPLALLLLGGGLWSLANALAIGASTLEGKALLFRGQFLFTGTIPLLWFLFARRYAGYQIRPFHLALLLVMPLLTLGLALTNGQHHLVLRQVGLDRSVSPPAFTWEQGWWLIVDTVYQYGLVLAGTIVLLRRLYRAPPLFRSQMVALLVAVTVPWLANLPYQLVSVPRALPLAALGIISSVLAFLWALYRHRLLDVAPVAHELLLQTLADPVLVLDGQQRLVELNRAAVRLLGGDGRAVGQPLASLTAATESALYEAYGAAVRDGEQQTLTLTAEGKTRHYTLQVEPLHDDQPHDRGHLLVLHDITTLHRALREARAATEAKAEFVSNVSHELRNPLTSIKLYLDLLRRGPAPNASAYLEALAHDVERLQHLIEDLLQVSRLDLGKIQPQLQPIDLNGLVEALCQERQLLFADRDLHFSWKTAPLPPVAGDARLLEQVLGNLLANALNYTPAGGYVRVTTAPDAAAEAAGSIVQVEDSGVGVAPEEQAQIFERFVRGRASRELDAAGTGLGLAISREIMALHQGHISVESREGEGSVFTLWLPAG